MIRRALGVAPLLAAFALSLPLAFLSGCTIEEAALPAAKGRPALVPVRGTVRVEGAPLAGAVVALLPVFDGTGTHAIGGTGEDGSFRVESLGMPGCAPGEYRVVVSYMVGADGTVADLSARSADVIPDAVNTGVERLPPRYSDARRTELRATVGREGIVLDLDLEGPLDLGEPSRGRVRGGLRDAPLTAEEPLHLRDRQDRPDGDQSGADP